MRVCGQSGVREQAERDPEDAAAVGDPGPNPTINALPFIGPRQQRQLIPNFTLPHQIRDSRPSSRHVYDEKHFRYRRFRGAAPGEEVLSTGPGFVPHPDRRQLPITRQTAGGAPVPYSATGDRPIRRTSDRGPAVVLPVHVLRLWPARGGTAGLLTGGRCAPAQGRGKIRRPCATPHGSVAGRPCSLVTC
jgi:hypothetical protein